MVSYAQCLPNDITFTSQAQIDSFPMNYPGCTVVEGDMIIQENDLGDIISLDSLYPLTTVDGYFQITSNFNLTSLKGLENLTEARGGLDILSSPGLTDLNGLNNLIFAKSMYLAANTNLSSLEGLENLSTVEESFTVQFSEVANLNGLNKLTSVNELKILSNSAITSLEGLDSLDYSTIEFLEIFLNAQLAICNIQPVCDYLENGGMAFISDNAPGCNTQQEVEDACGIVSSKDLLPEKVTISISPNPVTDLFYIKAPGTTIETVEIYTAQGQKIAQVSGNGKNEFDLSRFPSGVYLVQIQLEEGVVVKKVVKA